MEPRVNVFISSGSTLSAARYDKYANAQSGVTPTSGDMIPA